MSTDNKEEKIRAITKAFKRDARRSNAPRKEKAKTLHKRIQEVQIGTKIPGTDVVAREYWDHIITTQNITGDDGMHVNEDAFANPDVLAEDETPFNRPLTTEGELMMQAVREVTAEMSGQQRSILQLSLEGVWSDHEGQRLFTEQAIADELKITRDNVHMVLSRIKTKVRRRCEKLKAAKE